MLLDVKGGSVAVKGVVSLSLVVVVGGFVVVVVGAADVVVVVDTYDNYHIYHYKRVNRNLRFQ